MSIRLATILTATLIAASLATVGDTARADGRIRAVRGAAVGRRAVRPPYSRLSALEAMRRYHYGYYRDYGAEFWGIAPSVKYKYHRLPVYETPRLGLQYLYPDADRYGDPIGLQLPPDPEEPLIPGSTDSFLPDLPPDRLGPALDLFKQGRLAEAGALLSDEIKEDLATLETFLVISELLAANGKFDSAARVLLHGLTVSPDLGALDGVYIPDHFPTAEHFSSSLKKLGEVIEDPQNPPGARARLKLLRAVFRLLSGDGETAMQDLADLEDQTPVGPAAKRLYLHFIDRLFDTQPPRPLPKPGVDPAPQPLPKPPVDTPPAGGGDTGETDQGDHV